MSCVKIKINVKIKNNKEIWQNFLNAFKVFYRQSFLKIIDTITIKMLTIDVDIRPGL